MPLLCNVPSGRNLSKPLGRVAAAASGRTPTEECVLLDAGDHGLTLTTIDVNSHQLCLNVPEADATDHGQVLINAATFKEFSAGLEGASVHLAYNEDDNILKMVGETDLELETHLGLDKFVLEEVPASVGIVDAHQFSLAIDRATALLDDGEFVTLVAKDDQLIVYTLSRGSMYSRAAIELRESSGDFEISIPMARFAHMPPKITGLAHLCLHPDYNSFAVRAGNDYLLILSIVNDITSLEVEDWVTKPSTDYWTLKSDKFLRDLQRANRFKDNAGLKLETSKNRKFMHASCKSSGVGKMNTPHELIDIGGDTLDVCVDPKTLEQAVKVLGSVDVVVEQIREKVFDGKKETENVWLRLRDPENPDHRVVVVSTLV